MQLQKLEKLKREYQEYRKSIDSLETYLRDLEKKKIYTIEPTILSKQLRIPYSVAIYLLGLAEKTSLLKRTYQVFTISDNFPLGEFNKTEDIPDSIYNPATDEIVDKDGFFIDLIYHIKE